MKKLLFMLVLAFTIFTAATASADAAYLYVDTARDKARAHVWNTGAPNCNGWDRCYAYPVGTDYERKSRTRVHIQVRGYFRVHRDSGSFCHRNLYIEGTDNNPKVVGGTGWLCLV